MTKVVSSVQHQLPIRSELIREQEAASFTRLLPGDAHAGLGGAKCKRKHLKIERAGDRSEEGLHH